MKLAGYGQGLNARLSAAGFDRQGSNSSSGADTKGAGGADQHGMGRSSSHAWAQQQGAVLLDSDAAAAADGVTVR
jgi:hypothetical protein